MRKKILAPLLALEKIRAWCAFQERCQSEVRRKLREWGLDEEVAESHIAQLISEGFIDEERFARAFARGKFRIKKWGKAKIRYELRKKGVSERNIRCAMEEIGAEETAETIALLVQKLREKKRGIQDLRIRDYRIHTYLVGKGYDPEEVRRALFEK